MLFYASRVWLRRSSVWGEMLEQSMQERVEEKLPLRSKRATRFVECAVLVERVSLDVGGMGC